MSKAEGIESLQSIARDSAEKVSFDDSFFLLCNSKYFGKFNVKVTELVNEAARDINFYMQKAPFFDFTILNSSPG